jgi:RNA polymerase sigma-70 factor (ECF subfamily)
MTPTATGQPPFAAMSPDRHEWFLNQVFCHRQMLHQYLRKYLSSDEDIEDVIQDTYVRIYGIQDYTTVESPKALLITIAHNLAVELGRRRVSRATDAVADFDTLGVSSGTPQLEEQLDARRRFEAFCSAVDTLPPICRRVFVLRKVYKLSQAEISAVLGISQSTIEKHVAKGLVRCRDHLRDHGLVDGAASTDVARTVRGSRDEGGIR